MNWENIITQLTEIAVEYGLKLFGAIVVWIVGMWIIKAITKGFDKMLINEKQMIL